MSVARRYEQALVHYISADVTHSDSTVTVGTVPADSVIIGTSVVVNTAFDGTAPSLVVGNSTTSDAYVAAGDVTETATGLTNVDKGEKVSSDTTVIATFSQSGDTTTGDATVIVKYVPNNG